MATDFDPVRRAALGLLPAGLLGPWLGGCESVPLAGIGPALEDDEPLSRAVSEALDAAPETTNANILVRTLRPGTVRLSGNVDTEITRTFAEQIAGGVDGVRRVVNTLFIRD